MAEHIPFSFELPQPQGREIAEWWRAGQPRVPEDALYALAHMKAERDDLLESLEGLVKIIEKAGLENLSNGVQLGPTSWYVRASDAMTFAKRMIVKAKGQQPDDSSRDDWEGE